MARRFRMPQPAEQGTRTTQGGGRAACAFRPDRQPGFDHRIHAGGIVRSSGIQGVQLPEAATSDNAQFVFNFWELPAIGRGWEFFQFAPDAMTEMSGCSHVIFWGDEQGRYASHAAALRLEGRLGGWRSGHAAWGKRGIAVNRMGDLPASLYFGSTFDCNVAVLIPGDEKDVPAIWAYCSSPKYGEDVRKLNKKLSVTNGALTKVPYAAEEWERTAGGRTTAELFSVHTTDPAQWAFHGHPGDATEPLQVAMARLLGYRWPAESDPDMGLSEAARVRLGDTRSLHDFEDKDGIVCLPSVLGERPAEERLLGLLAACWGADWHDGVLSNLLINTGGSSLDDWLRDRFFDGHCKLFHNRPFIWHIWDGRRGDGFHAFVNYHKLAAGDGRGRQLLESLTYSYLGDWISRQQDALKRNRGGAEARLAAALELQKRLAAILEGEPPFDIFIRWKSIDNPSAGRRTSTTACASTSVPSWPTTVLEQAEVLSAAWAENKPPLLGFRPFPKRGGVVTDEPIDRLREEVGD